VAYYGSFFAGTLKLTQSSQSVRHTTEIRVSQLGPICTIADRGGVFLTFTKRDIMGSVQWELTLPKGAPNYVGIKQYTANKQHGRDNIVPSTGVRLLLPMAGAHRQFLVPPGHNITVICAFLAWVWLI